MSWVQHLANESHFYFVIFPEILWFLIYSGVTLFFLLWFFTNNGELETVNCLFENMFPGLCKSFVLTPLMSPFKVLFDFDFPNWAVSHRSILELILELRLIQRGKREKMINWPWIFFLVPMVTVNIHIQTHLVWLTKF